MSGALVCERDNAHRMGVAAVFATVAEAGALIVRPGLGAAGVAAVRYARACCVCWRRRRNKSDNACRANCGQNDGEHGLEDLGLSHDRGITRWKVQRSVDVLVLPDGVIDASVSNDCATL